MRQTLLAILLVAMSTNPALSLDVGDIAPSFTLAGSDGASHSLEDVLRKRAGVVLAWFPKAFTPG